MAKKFFTDESLATFVNETKTYTNNAVAELSSVVVYASDSNENISTETDGILASEVSYVNTTSGLSSTNVQTAIDKLSEETSQLSSEIGDLNITKVEQSDLEDEVKNQLDGTKAEIVTELLAQIGGMPVFGTVSEDNTITLTSMLADGAYTMVFENDEGIVVDICEFTIGNGDSDEPNINEYEVDIATVGYTDNARWSITDGTIRTGATGYTTINKISFERESGQTVTINLSGITWTDSALATQYASILLYVDDSYTTGNNLYLKELPKDFTDVGVRAVLNEDNSITITIYDGSNGTMFNGFKLCGVGSGANAKITITIE